MKKCIFIDYKLIKTHSNISINISTPNNEKKVKDVSKEERYFSIIKNNNDFFHELTKVRIGGQNGRR